MAGKGDNGMDAANLFKPMLARGQLRCIGATTLAEYRKVRCLLAMALLFFFFLLKWDTEAQYIEKDAAFERRFQQVLVNEPSVPETISILRGLREKYEVRLIFHVALGGW
jgi:ATP-dependent Clp protease ATP-binding subunit ClpB